jgi:hypothetical protein
MNRFAFDNASLFIPDISSYLSLGYNAGLSSFVLQNVEGFDTSGYIALEELGSKTWEILSINTINTSTNTITTNETSKFAHAFNKKVYSNDWLLIYNNNWQGVIDNLASWSIDSATNQKHFYNLFCIFDQFQTKVFALHIFYRLVFLL